MSTKIRIAKVEYGRVVTADVEAIDVSGVWAYDARNVVTHIPTGCSVYVGSSLAKTRRVFKQLANDIPRWGHRAKWTGRGMKGRTKPVIETIRKIDKDAFNWVRL